MTRGEKVIAFIEKYCLTPEGMHVGKPIVLAPFQKKFILEVYDNVHTTKRAILSIARKNGKTALIAGILLAHICGPEAQLNTQIISGALSRDQAALVFALASKMVQLSPELSAVCRVVPSGKKIIGLRKNVEYKALAADGSTAHGLSPVLAILDELGQVRGPKSDFVDAIVTSQGAHERPLLITISTQAPTDIDLLSQWIDDGLTGEDPQTIVHLYAADEKAQVTDREAWSAANPALGVFRSLPDVEEQSARAARMPSFENTFRNLVLNQRVDMNTPFISRSVWELNSGTPDDSAFIEGDVYGGLDLSTRNDLTALALVAFYEEKWHAKVYFWTPLAGLEDRSKRDKAPYDIWVDKGYIKTAPSTSIDYEFVARDIAEITEGMNISKVAFDRWRFDILKKEIDEIGVDIEFVPHGQGFKDMSPAVEAIETVLLNNQMLHGNNPVLNMCMHNCKVLQDPSGNRKLDKSKSSGRIDGIVALTMAMGIASGTVQDNSSYLDNESIMIL